MLRIILLGFAVSFASMAWAQEASVCAKLQSCLQSRAIETCEDRYLKRQEHGIVIQVPRISAVLARLAGEVGDDTGQPHQIFELSQTMWQEAKDRACNKQTGTEASLCQCQFNQERQNTLSKSLNMTSLAFFRQIVG